MDARLIDQLARQLGMRASRRTALSSALAGLALGAAGHAAAQEGTPAATPETSSASGERPIYMFVQTAVNGRGELNPAAGTPVAAGPSPAAGATPPAATPAPAPFLLTLREHSGQTIYFSDRPDRIFGALPTKQFLDELGFTPANPPNAALVGEFKAGQGVVVLTLTDPVYDAQTDTLTYGADTLAGYADGNLAPVTREQMAERLPAEFGSAALFIDDCPYYDSCYEAVYDIHNYVWNSYYLGPIPGGPYHECWHLIGGCKPCSDWTTYDLRAKCSSAYGCPLMTGGYSNCAIG